MARRRPTALVDVLDRVLDKGIVIDASVRVSLVGIDLLGVDAKITVASFETYLQLADDPRAYELGLVTGRPPRPPLQENALRMEIGPAALEAGPVEGAVGGGGGGDADDPERLGRAAYREEEPELPGPDEPDPASEA